MLDFITLILIAILILYAIREGRPFFLDAALVLAALSFISTTAAARYQSEGRPF
jgi:multicomponent Na+:H+ antiporter subunit F